MVPQALAQSRSGKPGGDRFLWICLAKQHRSRLWTPAPSMPDHVDKSWINDLPTPDPGLTKRTQYVVTSGLPLAVNPKEVLSVLHNHVQLLSLSPMLLHQRAIDGAPPNATPEEISEFKWYAVTDKIVYTPLSPNDGVGGKVTYYVGFCNETDGLRTKVYSPGGVEIGVDWRVKRSKHEGLMGEEHCTTEKRVEMLQSNGIAEEALWLIEEVDLRCNMLHMNFIKRNLKGSHVLLVERLLNKAEAMGGDTS